MSIKYATQTTASTGYVTNKEADSLLALYQKHFEKPVILAEKTNATTFVPATFRLPTRNDNNVVSSGLIIFDIDQKLGEGYDNDMIALEEAEDALLDMNLEHFIYTSHSHTLQAPRFRIVIAVARPYFPGEHNTICAAMLESLDEFLDGRLLRAIDPCWRVPSQCYYVYTTHPDRHSHAISFYNPGKPADVDELKLHQSQYGLESQYKPGASRPATGNTGARGRSYELNRIVGGMITSSTEAEIAARLYEHDNTQHAGNEYFRDMQYPRNRPRPGESGDAAAWRSCQIFAKSHINSLKRKFRKQIDTTIVVKKASSTEPMPTHDAMIRFRSFNSKPTKSGGETVLLEMQVMSGEHAGRHFWHRLYGSGNHETAIKISNSIIQKISKATQTPMESLKDIIKAEGKTIKARIKLKPGTKGFKPQNEIGDIHLNQL
ncbi:DUF669 domain-containing protein [Pseudomonas asiatica]|uniref:DUF669 domain-containing protein n=1 Tax=Pseudomonas asiatica TaxID=2219225 RepID=UPI0025A02791|nr:DUF669 domain-containing protein [Pseudomonas asiatica]MDM9588306.1 DUF669 domain-containing protein [Pseudomonas asiatica]WJM51588.1 DUF669 domain-containing protein [Pseudomonas asiatica]